MAIKIIHSSTKLLLAWIAILKESQLAVRNLPWNITTHWNLTFDILDFALEYQAGMDGIVDQNKLGMSSYGLDDKEWMLLEQLHNILKAHHSCELARDHDADYMWLRF